jgi:hypothetical protein
MHPDDRVPLILGGVDEHPVADESGVVDEDVQPSVRLDGLSHHRLGIREVGHISRIGNRLPTCGNDLLDHLLRGRFAGALARQRDAEVVDDHLRTMTGELERVSPADASPRSGDDRDPAFEQSSHGGVPFQSCVQKPSN